MTAPGAALPSRGGHAQPPGREYRPLLLCSLLKATPKVPTTPVKAKRVSTFQEFESNTSDAWDAGEDDDELLAMAAESLNTAVVMETAHRVLRNHSQQQGRSRPPGAPEPPAEPPAAPGGDLRLVKSVSESHASCPEGGGGGGRGGGGRGGRVSRKRPGALSPGDEAGRVPALGGSAIQQPRASWSAEAAALPLVLLAEWVSLLMAWPGGSSCGLLGGPRPSQDALAAPGGLSSPGARPASCSGLDLPPATSDDPSRSPTRGLSVCRARVCSLESPGSDSKL